MAEFRTPSPVLSEVTPAAPDLALADSPASPVLSNASSPALPPHAWHNPTTSPILISSDSPTASIESIGSDDSADSITSIDSLDSVASPLSPTWGHPYHPDLSSSGPAFSPPLYTDIYRRALTWKVDPQTKLAWEGWQLWYSATLAELRTGADPDGTLVPNLWAFRDLVIADYAARFPNDPEPPTVYTFCPFCHEADASNLKYHGIEPPETDFWA